MTKLATARVEATITFKGSVDLSHWDGMTVSEVIHDIIYAGDYEYEVIRGDVDFEELED